MWVKKVLNLTPVTILESVGELFLSNLGEERVCFSLVQFLVTCPWPAFVDVDTHSEVVHLLVPSVAMGSHL